MTDHLETDIWTPERIARFWDLVAAEPRLEQRYFSRSHAPALVHLAVLFGLNGGDVLDYGCGPGFLSQELVRRGFDTTAVDHSVSSREKANQLLSNEPRWKGAFDISDLPEESLFDWIFSIETYEHLREEWVSDYFSTIATRLKPGGRVLITTPYAEDLTGQLIICPCCEAKFHRWGHLRSVSQADLRRRAEHVGLKVAICRQIDLGNVLPVQMKRLEMWIETRVESVWPRPIEERWLVRRKLRRKKAQSQRNTSTLVLIGEKPCS